MGITSSGVITMVSFHTPGDVRDVMVVADHSLLGFSCPGFAQHLPCFAQHLPAPVAACRASAPSANAMLCEFVDRRSMCCMMVWFSRQS